MAVPVRTDLVAGLADLARRQEAAILRGLSDRRLALRAASRALPDPERLLDTARQRLDSLAERLPNALVASTTLHRARLARAQGRLAPGLLTFRLARENDRTVALGGRLIQSLARSSELRRERFGALSLRLDRSLVAYGEAQTARITRAQDRLTALWTRAGRAVDQAMRQRADALAGQANLLNALSYRGVLARGFALVRDADGQPVREARAIAAGAALTLEFADGRRDVRAEGTSPHASPPVPAAPRAQPKPARRPEGQGDLF
jgi:exodeoxyribonuclease VII large subunit